MTNVQPPIRYQETSTMAAAFAAPTERLALLTPAPLRVVELWPGRAPLAIVCFDYVRTDVGAYGEVGVTWPVVPRAEGRGALPLLPLVPLLFEARWPGLGWWVHQLPVTSEIARRAGREIWGYPKRLASIDFSWDGAKRTCAVEADDQEVLRLTIDTRMPAFPSRFPLRTWSALGDELLRTTVEVDAVGLRRMASSGAALRFGPHPIGRELAALGAWLSRPIEVRWFPTWRAVLPEAAERIPLARAGAARPAARAA